MVTWSYFHYVKWVPCHHSSMELVGWLVGYLVDGIYIIAAEGYREVERYIIVA